MDNEKKDMDLKKLKIDKPSDLSYYSNAKSRRNLIRTVVIVAVLLLIYLLYKNGLFSSSKSVEIAAVSAIYPFQEKTVLNASGYVVAQRKAAVASKGTGRLVYLGVEEGSLVKKGDVIARIENGDMVATLRRAEANLKVANSNLNQTRAELNDAKVDYERKKILVSDGTISKSIFDTADARYKTAQASFAGAEFAINAAKAAVNEASVQVEYTYIRAPFDGTVLTKDADMGEVVAPFGSSVNAKAAVVTMADMDSLLVEADVSETNVGSVKVGQPCVITLDAYPESRFKGVVHMIVPTADRAKATILTKVKFIEFDKRIVPEMSARVAFLSENVSEDMLQKPKTAVNAGSVVSKEKGSVVFLIKGDRAVETPVKIGSKMNDMLEILQGLSPGNKVVMNPAKDFKSGTKIEISQK